MRKSDVIIDSVMTSLIQFLRFSSNFHRLFPSVSLLLFFLFLFAFSSLTAINGAAIWLTPFATTFASADLHSTADTPLIKNFRGTRRRVLRKREEARDNGVRRSQRRVFASASLLFSSSLLFLFCFSPPFCSSLLLTSRASLLIIFELHTE